MRPYSFQLHFHILVLLLFIQFDWLIECCAVSLREAEFPNPVIYKPLPEKIEAVEKNCGKRQIDDQDVRTRVPWNVGIYLRSRSNASGSQSSTPKAKFLLTGTIIGPRTVLTVIGGAFGVDRPSGGKYLLWPPTRLMVVAGISSTNLDNLDHDSQIADVENIVPFPSRVDEFPEYHFILLHLKQELSFRTAVVRSVCLPLQLLGGQINSQLGLFWLKLTSGFTYHSSPATAAADSSSFELKELNVTTPHTLPECQELFSQIYQAKESPYNPYCAQTKEKDFEESGCLLQGGRVTVEGVLAAIIGLVHHPNGTCSKDTVYFYGGILPPLKWVYNNLLCGPDGFACLDNSCIKFSHVCNGIRDCPKEHTGNRVGVEYFNDENPSYCSGLNLCTSSSSSTRRDQNTTEEKTQTHSCGIGQKCIAEDGVCNGIVDCENQSDEKYCW